MGFTTPNHAAWDGEPHVFVEFQPIPEGGHYVDRFVAYITGRDVEGKRYCRTVEVTGHQMEDGSADKRRNHVLARVRRDGPSLCTLINEGGDYPRESDQPPIE